MKRLNIESFEKVWTTVRDTYWDPKIGGVDWQGAHDEFRPAVERAGTMAQAREAMTGMLSRLHQTHFGIIPGDVYEEVDAKPEDTEGRTGIDVRVIGGQALVTSVDEDSPAARAGVRQGWRILRIDGKEVGPGIESVAKAYADSTLRELMLSRALLAKLGATAEGVRVEFLDGAGKTVALKVEEGAPRGKATKFGMLPTQYVWVESRKLDGSAGYIAFNMFLDPARLMPAFEDAIKSFQGADGIVIDIRGNPGGIGTAWRWAWPDGFSTSRASSSWARCTCARRLAEVCGQSAFPGVSRAAGNPGGRDIGVHVGNFRRRPPGFKTRPHLRNPHGRGGLAVVHREAAERGRFSVRGSELHIRGRKGSGGYRRDSGCGGAAHARAAAGGPGCGARVRATLDT